MARLYPVIMSGGSGTRMWPLSRRSSPKQFLPLLGEQSLFQQTLERIAPGASTLDIAPVTVICGLGHLEPVEAQLKALSMAPHAILLEPEGRNTAVVAAVAAAHIQASDPDGLILLLPADHHIADKVGFWESIERGLEAAMAGHLVTLGIQPTHAETGYGYIQRGEPISPHCYHVGAFKEKPDASVAEAYLTSGDYFWNAGIFLFGASAMLGELQTYAIDILQSGQSALAAAKRDGARIYLDPQTFKSCRSDSIDYAVMEQTGVSAIVAPVDIGWNDIGSWSALQQMLRPEPADNHTSGEVVAHDCRGTYIRSEGPLIAAIGIEDLIVVARDDAVLIISPDKAQDVKAILQTLKADGRDDLL